MSLENHLVVFVKAPRLGAVKRRLAAGVGDVAAWRFYRGTSSEILRRLVGGGRWRCWLAITPDRHAAGGRFWPLAGPSKWRRLGQGPGDIGRRMERAVRAMPPGPVVIVGSDIPEVTAVHVARAFAALGRSEVVFGPAADGGYWLVGVRRRPRLPDLFRSVRWSSPHALADTLANLAPGARVERLDLLEDIDDAAALARWRRRRG